MTAVSYHIKIDTKIDQIEQAAWDGLCGQRPFATVHWLQLLEKTVADYQPRYIQLWQDGRLMAGAMCQPQRHFHLSAYLKSPILHKVASKALAMLPPFACTLPLFLRDGLLVRPEVETAVWLPLLLDEVEKASRQRWAPFTYLGNLNAWQNDIVEQKSYTTIPILQDSYINVSWDSYEAYLRHLTAKRRKNVLVATERAESAGVVVQEAEYSAALLPKMEALIRGVATEHDNTFLYRPNFLHHAHDHLKREDYRVLIACIQDELIGCATLLRSGDEVTAKWSGLNYARTRETHAYHYLAINVVKKAIELGAKRLDIGPTTYVLKRQLGAELEDRFAALKVGIRPLNTVFHTMTNRSRKATL